MATKNLLAELYDGDDVTEHLLRCSPQGLLTTFASLTHRIHSVESTSVLSGPGATERRTEEAADLRRQRDLVEAEILRRMG